MKRIPPISLSEQYWGLPYPYSRQFYMLESGFEEWLPGQVSAHHSHPTWPGFEPGMRPSLEEVRDASLFSESTAGLFSAARGCIGNPAVARVTSGMVVPIEKDAPLVAIVGPTAAGKSVLALALAAALDGEIVNYDSVQLYRGFDIGSGKLPPQERHGVPHHLLDCLEAEQQFTAGDYRREALRVLVEIKARERLPIFAGRARGCSCAHSSWGCSMVRPAQRS